MRFFKLLLSAGFIFGLSLLMTGCDSKDDHGHGHISLQQVTTIAKV